MQRRSSVSHVTYCRIGTTSPDPRSPNGEHCPTAAAAVPWSSAQSAAWRRACRRAFRRARRHMSCGPPKISGVGCGLRMLRALVLFVRVCPASLSYSATTRALAPSSCFPPSKSPLPTPGTGPLPRSASVSLIFTWT